MKPGGEHEAGCLAHVVRVWLEREPEQRDRLAGKGPEVLLELPDDAPLLKLVDLDDSGQELEVVARVTRELLERRNIFRKTGTTIARACAKKRRADPLVQAHTPRDLGDVRTHLLADVGDLVDE